MTNYDKDRLVSDQIEYSINDSYTFFFLSNAKKENKNDKLKAPKELGQKGGESSSKPKVALECTFCEGPYYSDDCPVEKTVEEAKECAAEKHLCFKCFQQPNQHNNNRFFYRKS